jgi:tryptophan synthase alpha chain
LSAIAAGQGIDLIYLVAPNTTPKRLEQISSVAGGFIYAVALKGVTGAANLDAEQVARQVAAIRQTSQLPVAVGFGVRDPQGAAAVARVADGVIVGSALVKMIADHGHVADLPQRLRDAAAALRRGMDEATQSGGGS